MKTNGISSYNAASEVRAQQAAATGQVASDAAQAQPVEAAAAVPQDRVEISEAGRAAAEDSRANEMNFAKKALLGIPPLNAERAEDILKRVQEGFYSQPEVARQVAPQATSDILGSGF